MKICLSTSTNEKGAYDVQCHFHQYFSNIVAAILLLEVTGVSGETHRLAATNE
jgi:hypothetical protein